MAFSLFSKKQNPIAGRCRDDASTKLRLRYAPYYHALEAQQGTTVRLDGRDLIMLASNDYLGLSFHPKVIEASRAATLKWGTSATGARVANGSRAYHVELEEKLAAFLGKEACHVHAAGYLSCLSGIAGFAQKGDVILADKNIHSCLWDGIRLSTAAVERFSHNSADDLRAVAAGLPAATPKMLVVEGVYSMEGHIASLPALLAAAAEFDCFNVLDDARGFGVLGRQGRGTADHFGLTDQVDILCGCMSKALASTGGFVAGSRALIEYLRTHGKHTLFSASLARPKPPPPPRSTFSKTNPSTSPASGATPAATPPCSSRSAWIPGTAKTPAVPIVLGDKQRAYAFWQALREKGVFAIISIAPAVPPGKDLIRTAISAGHTDEQLERIAEAMGYAAKRS